MDLVILRAIKMTVKEAIGKCKAKYLINILKKWKMASNKSIPSGLSVNELAKAKLKTAHDYEIGKFFIVSLGNEFWLVLDDNQQNYDDSGICNVEVVKLEEAPAYLVGGDPDYAILKLTTINGSLYYNYSTILSTHIEDTSLTPVDKFQQISV